jgi:hypothetical protein
MADQRDRLTRVEATNGWQMQAKTLESTQDCVTFSAVAMLQGFWHSKHWRPSRAAFARMRV